LKKRKWIIIAIPLVLLLLFALTYIPHKVVNIEASKVSEITVLDGNTGNKIEVTNITDIDHIINNLNGVTFQKGKSAFGYKGYSFRTTIYDEKGKSIRELIINSNDTIIYKGFFYTVENNSIDYDYIKKLVHK